MYEGVSNEYPYIKRLIPETSSRTHGVMADKFNFGLIMDL